MKVIDDDSKGIARFFSHHPAGWAGDTSKQLNNPLNMDAVPGAYPASTPYGRSRVMVPIVGTQLSQQPRNAPPGMGLPPGYDSELAAMPMPTELAMGASLQGRQGDARGGIRNGFSTSLSGVQASKGKRKMA